MNGLFITLLSAELGLIINSFICDGPTNAYPHRFSSIQFLTARLVDKFVTFLTWSAYKSFETINPWRSLAYDIIYTSSLSPAGTNVISPFINMPFNLSNSSVSMTAFLDELLVFCGFLRKYLDGINVTIEKSLRSLLNRDRKYCCANSIPITLKWSLPNPHPKGQDIVDQCDATAYRIQSVSVYH